MKKFSLTCGEKKKNVITAGREEVHLPPLTSVLLQINIRNVEAEELQVTLPSWLMKGTVPLDYNHDMEVRTDDVLTCSAASKLQLIKSAE